MPDSDQTVRSCKAFVGQVAVQGQAVYWTETSRGFEPAKEWTEEVWCQPAANAEPLLLAQRDSVTISHLRADSEGLCWSEAGQEGESLYGLAWGGEPLHLASVPAESQLQCVSLQGDWVWWLASTPGLGLMGEGSLIRTARSGEHLEVRVERIQNWARGWTLATSPEHVVWGTTDDARGIEVAGSDGVVLRTLTEGARANTLHLRGTTLYAGLPSREENQLLTFELGWSAPPTRRTLPEGELDILASNDRWLYGIVSGGKRKLFRVSLLPGGPTEVEAPLSGVHPVSLAVQDGDLVWTANWGPPPAGAVMRRAAEAPWGASSATIADRMDTRARAQAYMFARGCDKILVGDETVWTLPLGDSCHRLENVTFYSPFSAGDVVRCRPPDEAGQYEVAEALVERGSGRKLTVRLVRPPPRGEKPILKRLMAYPYEFEADQIHFSVRREDYDALLEALDESDVIEAYDVWPDDYADWTPEE